jgi:hypothetical protein
MLTTTQFYFGEIMELHDNNVLLKSIIRRNEKLIESILTDVEFKHEYEILNLFLNELLNRRNKDCDHILIPMKNEIIDSGYICTKCGKVFEEYIGVFNVN